MRKIRYHKKADAYVVKVVEDVRAAWEKGAYVAYDIAFRRRIARDVSRGDETAQPPGSGALRATAAGLALLLPHLARGTEVAHYRRKYGKSSEGFDLHTTQETPALTNEELVYGTGETGDAT